MEGTENKGEFLDIRLMDYSDELLKQIIEAYLEEQGGISPETMSQQFPKNKGVTARTIRFIIEGKHNPDKKTIQKILALAGLKLTVSDDENRILKKIKSGNIEKF